MDFRIKAKRINKDGNYCGRKFEGKLTNGKSFLKINRRSKKFGASLVILEEE